jgi:hypothetical protein
VHKIELDLATATLRAFGVQSSGIARAMRVPVEWISDADAQGNLWLAATQAELDGSI